MISLDPNVDRGKALYARFPGALNRRVNDLVESYYGSTRVFQALKRRIATFDDLYDLRFKGNEAFISEIAVPVSRKIMLETKAYIRKYFENDPLFTLFGRYDTPPANAETAQQVLNYNLQMTHYRRDCMLWQIDCAAKYGVYVTYSQYVEGYGQRGTHTIYDPNTIGGYVQERQQATRKNVVNYPIHPLNYFQDVNTIFSYSPSFKGFIDRWTVAQLYNLRGDERYLQDVLTEVLAKARRGIPDQHYFGADGSYYSTEVKDMSQHEVHVRRMFCTMPIEGNEDDDTTYYVESLDNKIIRIEENQYDKDMCPLTVGNMLPRINTWWGNAQHESKIAHQNLMNFLVQSQVESTMKAMDRIVFVRQGGGVDWAAVNNRHRLGGIVPVQGMEPLQNQAYQLQFQDPTLKSVDWLVRELKEEIQSENPITNLQSGYNQGGLNNKTLGAAQMIASIGEVLQGDVMTNFGFGQQRVAEANITALQQLLEDQFFIKRTPEAEPVMVDKYKILGDYDFVVETALKFNEIQDFQKRANLLTQLLNWKAAGVVELNGVNWGQIVKDILKNGIGTFTDLKKYYDESKAMQQPMNPAMMGAMGGNTAALAAPTAPPQGAPPAPAPAPMPAGVPA